MKFIKKIKNKFLVKLKSKINDASSVSNPELIGKNVWLSNAVLDGPISIGSNCIIKDCVIRANKMTVGNNTSLWGPNITIHALRHPISIGSYTSVAKNVTIQEYAHNVNKVSTYFMASNIFNGDALDDVVSKGSIIIGNDVWIASNVVVGSGVNIGHGAVIGANSVVLNDVPPYTFVAGSPAKIIRYRFSPEIINMLLMLEWWNWDHEKIKRNQFLFSNELTLDAFKQIH